MFKLFLCFVLIFSSVPLDVTYVYFLVKFLDT